MKRQLWLVALLAAFAIPTTASAERLERTKHREVGDKATYDYVMKGQSMRLVEEVVEVTDAEIRSTVRVGDKTYDRAYATRDFSLLRGSCLSDGKACQWSPALVWIKFPLEIGKTWSDTYTVTGETFICKVTSEVKVDGVEEITTPAGQFDTFRVYGRDRLDCGPISSGTGTYWTWVASIKGKLVVVKQEYRNSFGSWMRRELLSAELK